MDGADPPRERFPTTYAGYLDPEYLRRRFGRKVVDGAALASDSDDDDSDDDSSSADSTTSSEAERLARLEWDESVRQLQLLLDVVFLPFVGKWAGRKWAYWAYGRYQDRGFTKAFFGGVFAGEAAVKTAQILAS